MVEAKKNERANGLKEEMGLNKDFGFYLSLPSEFLAEGQKTI